MALTVNIFSFSYKRGLPADLGPDGGGFVFDSRALPNPFWEEGLHACNGTEPPIVDFFARHAVEVSAFMKPVEELVRNSIACYARDGKERLSIGFGCTGGKHRSVYCAESLAASLRDINGVKIEVSHLARDKWI